MRFRLKRTKKVVHVGVSQSREPRRGIERTQRTALKTFDERFGEDFLASVPTAPGVYRFHAPDGELIYIGKAVNLRNRLRQYRLATRRRRHWKMRSLVHAAATIDWEVSPDALAAALREVELIQQLRPRGNVVSAFAFLYPFIGLQMVGGELRLCWSTHPEPFASWRLHGAYRSRGVTGDAFFALTRLLSYLGHPVPRARLRPEVDLPHTRVFGFRQLPDFVAGGLEALLRGEDAAVLPELTMALLDKASARARAADIKADLRAVQRLWMEEAEPLRRAVTETGLVVWPVSQEARDPLFLRWREQAPENDPMPRRKRVSRVRRPKKSTRRVGA